MARVFRLQRAGGIALTLCDRGATWLACEVPMPDGQARNVILQRAGIEDREADSAFLGATVGRYANRIAHARIRLAERKWPLVPNPGSRHQLHGGPQGFHSRVWEVARLDEFALAFSLHSPNGDQGFPGDLNAQVIYRLVDGMTIEMESIVTVSEPCPVALTNHAYFNLDAEPGDVRAHSLRIAASQYMPVDEELIPIGGPASVLGTTFDFRSAKRIRDDWLADEQQRNGGGYDHAFLLDPGCAGLAHPAAELVSSQGDLRLAVGTTLPALQFYAGQYLGGIAMPSGAAYSACAGVALEPGFLPDSPNHPEWPQPSCWVVPGRAYQHTIRYRFEHAA